MTHRARGAPGVLVLLSTLGLGAAVLQTESGCGLCLPGHDYVDIDHGAIGVDGSCVAPEDEPVFDRCYWGAYDEEILCNLSSLMVYDADVRTCVRISSQCGEVPTDDPRIRPCAESEDAVCCDFETYLQDCVPQ